MRVNLFFMHNSTWVTQVFLSLGNAQLRTIFWMAEWFLNLAQRDVRFQQPTRQMMDTERKSCKSSFICRWRKASAVNNKCGRKCSVSRWRDLFYLFHCWHPLESPSNIDFSICCDMMWHSHIPPKNNRPVKRSDHLSTSKLNMGSQHSV